MKAWTESDYAAAGYGRLSLRLPLATLMRLRKIAAALESSPTKVVRGLIDECAEEYAARVK